MTLVDDAEGSLGRGQAEGAEGDVVEREAAVDRVAVDEIARLHRCPRHRERDGGAGHRRGPGRVEDDALDARDAREVDDRELSRLQLSAESDRRLAHAVGAERCLFAGRDLV